MRIGFFGAGNMATAMASAFKKNIPGVEMFFYTPSKVRAQALATNLNGNLIESLDLMPLDLDWYFLGFKPQSIASFEFNFNKESKIVSMLAGTNLTILDQKFPNSKIVRLMPNTPTRVLSGMNLIYMSEIFNLEEKNNFVKLMNTCGEVLVVKNESEIDLITPFSGSGPGLIFDLAHIFEASLKELVGNSVDTRKIIAQTFLGTSRLMLEDERLSFLDLKNQVTSKKGVTFAALEELDKGGITQLYNRAFKAANNRIQEFNNGENK